MSIRMGRKERFRPEMLPKPAVIYGYGRYPDRIRVSFMDGQTAVYEAQIVQPRPVFFSGEEVRRMSETVGSYQYKGAKRKWKRTRP